MKAKFVYESVNFERGSEPKSSMSLGVGSKEEITKAIDNFYEAGSFLIHYMDTAPFKFRDYDKWAFIIESEKSGIASKISELLKYSGLEIYIDKVAQLNFLESLPYVRKAGEIWQYIYYLKDEFVNTFDSALHDYFEI